MWGAGWVMSLIIGPLTVGIIVSMIMTNSRDIKDAAEHIIQHERSVNGSIHELEQTITIMSINQKRQMEASGVPYLDPERTQRHEY